MVSRVFVVTCNISCTLQGKGGRPSQFGRILNCEPLSQRKYSHDNLEECRVRMCWFHPSSGEISVYLRYQMSMNVNSAAVCGVRRVKRYFIMSFLFLLSTHHNNNYPGSRWDNHSRTKYHSYLNIYIRSWDQVFVIFTFTSYCRRLWSVPPSVTRILILTLPNFLCLLANSFCKWLLRGTWSLSHNRRQSNFTISFKDSTWGQ